VRRAGVAHRDVPARQFRFIPLAVGGSVAVHQTLLHWCSNPIWRRAYKWPGRMTRRGRTTGVDQRA
jgi:hypothetical protein